MALQRPAFTITDPGEAMKAALAFGEAARARLRVDVDDDDGLLFARYADELRLLARARVELRDAVDGVDEAVDEQRHAEAVTSGWVRPGEATVRLGVSKQRISKLVRTEVLRGRRVGSAVWIDPVSIEAYRARRAS